MRLPHSEECLTIWLQPLDEYGAPQGEPFNLNRVALMHAQIADIIICMGKAWIVQEREWLLPDDGSGFVQSTLTIFVHER